MRSRMPSNSVSPSTFWSAARPRRCVLRFLELRPFRASSFCRVGLARLSGRDRSPRCAGRCVMCVFEARTIACGSSRRSPCARAACVDEQLLELAADLGEVASDWSRGPERRIDRRVRSARIGDAVGQEADHRDRAPARSCGCEPRTGEQPKRGMLHCGLPRSSAAAANRRPHENADWLKIDRISENFVRSRSDVKVRACEAGFALRLASCAPHLVVLQCADP